MNSFQTRTSETLAEHLKAQLHKLDETPLDRRPELSDQVQALVLCQLDIIEERKGMGSFLEKLDERTEKILEQALRTNGRVSALEASQGEMRAVLESEKKVLDGHLEKHDLSEARMKGILWTIGKVAVVIGSVGSVVGGLYAAGIIVINL